jgi:hypothetical protein
MSARTRDVICLAACAMLGAIVWAIHLTPWSHATQRPLKVAVIVVGLAAVGGWRARQIRACHEARD